MAAKEEEEIDIEGLEEENQWPDLKDVLNNPSSSTIKTNAQSPGSSFFTDYCDSNSWILESNSVWSLDNCDDEKSRAAIEKMIMEEELYSHGYGRMLEVPTTPVIASEIPTSTARAKKPKLKKPTVVEESRPSHRKPWTKEEQDLFMEGLKLHGRSWTRIATMIPTRTVLQVKNYANQYFRNKHKVAVPAKQEDTRTSRPSTATTDSQEQSHCVGIGMSLIDSGACVRIENTSDDEEEVDIDGDIDVNPSPDGAAFPRSVNGGLVKEKEEDSYNNEISLSEEDPTDDLSSQCLTGLSAMPISRADTQLNSIQSDQSKAQSLTITSATEINCADNHLTSTSCEQSDANHLALLSLSNDETLQCFDNEKINENISLNVDSHESTNLLTEKVETSTQKRERDNFGHGNSGGLGLHVCSPDVIQQDSLTPRDIQGAGFSCDDQSPVDTNCSRDDQSPVGTNCSRDDQSPVDTSCPRDDQSPVGTSCSRDDQSPVGTSCSRDDQSPVGTNCSRDDQTPAGTNCPRDDQSPVDTSCSQDDESPVGTNCPRDDQSPVGTNCSQDDQSLVGTISSRDDKTTAGTSYSRDDQCPVATNGESTVEISTGTCERGSHEQSGEILDILNLRINRDVILDVEKAANKEFFMGRSLKTPARYLKIRNYILDMWDRCKPSYLFKTSVRSGLRNCGDVNSIGRVHSFLEDAELINVGCPERPRPKIRHTSETEPDKVESPAPIESWVNFLRPRKRRIRHDEGNWVEDTDTEGFTIAHLNGNEGEEQHSYTTPRPAIATRKTKVPRTKSFYDPFKLVPYRNFPSSSAEPFHVALQSDALIVMDVHAHLSTTEVIGLLGGTYSRDNRVLQVLRATPCRSLSTSMQCEMDPVSQTQASEKLASKGMAVVGWYHSHPTFAPNPSVRDIETQAKFQEWFAKGGAAFIGVIVSPYNYVNTSNQSQIKCLTVSQECTTAEQQRVPFQFDYEILERTTDSVDVVGCINELEAEYRHYGFRMPMTRRYSNSSPFTALDKLMDSIRARFRGSDDDKEDFISELMELFSNDNWDNDHHEEKKNEGANYEEIRQDMMIKDGTSGTGAVLSSDDGPFEESAGEVGRDEGTFKVDTGDRLKSGDLDSMAEAVLQNG
ncbi:deubiquitinase MYSM1 isoform X2 [Nematostella vectensis]|uniref:deubiquitinase MYSM1 isoform X2 n=1 Tax=Nematostella vectensis TaxID=45351 RepID=UPI00207700B8|nr:deubiquitinase MYSM1 isoform X2 [Nematostella vectensis]